MPKFKTVALLVIATGIIALSFVKAPEPLNPDTAPLPTAYEQYHRNEEQTYLTFPEWYIVYSSDEYAKFIKSNPPSAFPYFSSIKQFWEGYADVYCLTKDKYEFNTGYHVMVGVIGTSLTIEYTLKGIYENTVGRLSEWTASGRTEQEDFAADMQKEYVDFINIYPWYEYDFAGKLVQFITQTHIKDNNIIRKIERTFILSAEYAGKAVYGWVMKKLTYLSYEPESPFTVVKATDLPDSLLEKEKSMRLITKSDDGTKLIAFPRYNAFRNYSLTAAQEGANFSEIAGNSSVILVTVIADTGFSFTDSGETVFTQQILTQPTKKRLGLRLPVTSLTAVLTDLEKQGVLVEHIYDY